MRLAIPHWQGRISPVFDVAGALLLVDLDHGAATRQSIAMAEDSPLERARRIGELGVDTLICGAISWPLELALVSAGIKVIAQTCGDVEEVLDAFLTGRLGQGMFLMPGCCGRRRLFERGRPGEDSPESMRKEDGIMPWGNGMGPAAKGGGGGRCRGRGPAMMGQGQGQGQGQGWGPGMRGGAMGKGFGPCGGVKGGMGDFPLSQPAPVDDQSAEGPADSEGASDENSRR